MNGRVVAGLILVLVLAGLGHGCVTGSRPAGTAPDAPAPTRRSVDLSGAEPADAAEEALVQAQAHFSMGMLHELDQDFEAALEEYCLSAEADPANESLVVEVAQRLIQKKQAAKALRLLSKAANVPTATGFVNAWQGSALALVGETNQAVRANRLALKKNPQLLLAYQNLAQLYVAAGQEREVVKLLDRAGRQSEAGALFFVELAEILYQNSAPLEKAGIPTKPRRVELLNRAAAFKPDEPWLRQKLADGYKLAGELAKATDLYLALVRDYPQLLGNREKLTDTLLRSGDKKRALEQFEAIVRENPTRPQGYYLLGSLAIETKEYARAVEYLEKAMLLDPGFQPAYYELAGVLINLNKPPEALAILEKARARFPQNFVLEMYSAMACNRMKKYDQALSHFTAAEVIAAATDPQRLNAFFHFQVGSTYERKGDFALAEKSFRRCLELEPDHGEAMNYLGYMWADRGERLEEARALIEQAVKLEPDNAAYLDSLGWVWFKLGVPGKALGFVKQSVALSTEPDATLLAHLGDIYAALTQWEQAREAWNQSLAIEASDVVRKKLEALPVK